MYIYKKLYIYKIILIKYDGFFSLYVLIILLLSNDNNSRHKIINFCLDKRGQSKQMIFSTRSRFVSNTRSPDGGWSVAANN